MEVPTEVVAMTSIKLARFARYNYKLGSLQANSSLAKAYLGEPSYVDLNKEDPIKVQRFFDALHADADKRDIIANNAAMERARANAAAEIARRNADVANANRLGNFWTRPATSSSLGIGSSPSGFETIGKGVTAAALTGLLGYGAYKLWKSRQEPEYYEYPEEDYYQR